MLETTSSWSLETPVTDLVKVTKEINEKENEKEKENRVVFFFVNLSIPELPLISIAGLIGIGKSTLARALHAELGLPLYEEDVVGNPYLEDFYEDMARHSFALQIYLLNKRYAQQQLISWKNEGGISDRTIYEDQIFSKLLNKQGLMTDRNYDTYLSLAGNMFKSLSKPNLILYLDATPEECLTRIESRGREMEKSITLEYLQGLKTEYDTYFQAASKVMTVIKIRWSVFADVAKVVKEIQQYYGRQCSRYETLELL